MISRRMRNQKRRGPFLKVIFFAYFACCLFTMIWLRTSVVNLEYELGEYGNLRAELETKGEMAVAQRANNYSVEKIEKVALKRLGMTMPERENVFYVRRTSAARPVRASMK